MDRRGGLPTLASLGRRARRFRLDTCLQTMPSAIWTELVSGRVAGKTAFSFPIRQVVTGEVEPRALRAEECDPRAFWTAADGAGLRVAALDMPTTPPPRERFDGVFLCSWSEHDRLFEPGSVPAGFLDEVLERYGPYPIEQMVDHNYPHTAEGKERMIDDLLAGGRLARRLFVDTLEREPWDLFACTLSEAHSGGHYFGGWVDRAPPPGSGWGPRATTAMRQLYDEADATLGALLAAAPDATVVASLSHGMGEPVGGQQLLAEVVARLAGSGGGSAARARAALPAPVRRLARTLIRGRARERLQEAAGSLPHPLASPATRAYAPETVSAVGMVRLNLRGREPFGSVEPGPEAEALLEDLRQAMLELTIPETGARAVAAARTAVEIWGPDLHPDTPDLIVTFRRDVGRIDAVSSQRVGTVRLPYVVGSRTCDHTPDNALWVAGPGVEPGELAEGRAVDVAPTVLALLGVETPGWMDGRPLRLA
ncbi:MAG: alkaline phosphatase family protein [Thermoleophilia bacterium]